MATFTGTNMVFDDECEQVTYEIKSLIASSKDPRFTDYLQNSLEELKDYSNPMKLRDKIVENYNIYVQRMIRTGKTVDTVYHHAIYADMKEPEIKSPYSNSIGDNPYSNSDKSKKAATSFTQKENFKQNISIGTIIGKTFAFIGCVLVINAICGYISRHLSTYLATVINYETLLGKIIVLAIFSFLFGNIYFWSYLIISKFLVHKYSVVVGILLVAVLNLIAIAFIFDWVFGVIWFVQVASMGFPLLIQWADVS